jgi:hypothetical protein
MAKKELDLLTRLGFEYGFSSTSFSAAVQDVMNHVKGPKVKQLLKKLVDHKIELPKKIVIVRLAVAWLLQREIKHKQEHGTSLLPYNEKLYKRAVNYGKKNAKHYA